MKDTTNITAITIRIPSEVHAWLVEQAKKEKRSLNAQISLLLEQLYDQEQKS